MAKSSLTASIQDEYVFFAGRRVARVDSSGTVNFYFADALGHLNAWAGLPLRPHSR